MTYNKEYMKEYYKKNREKILEVRKENYKKTKKKKNREKILEDRRKHYIKNKKKNKKKKDKKKEEKIVICTACRSVDSMGMTRYKYTTLNEASEHTKLTVANIRDSIEDYKPAPDGFYYRWTNHEYA